MIKPEELSEELSQWFTPASLASRVVEWSCLRKGMNVLEPSSGDGALAREIAGKVERLFCIEMDQRFDRPQGCDEYIIGDFLKLSLENACPFDLVIMNPPYEGGKDAEHVIRALELAPRVVALLRLNFLAGLKRHKGVWSKNNISRLAVLRNRPKFVGPKNLTARSDYAVFEIVRGKNAAPTQIEWWEKEW